jgi:type VI secretion system secreted protein VgrG
VGNAQLTQVGNEIHIKAGDKVVIEAGMELTIKAGGSFIKLDASGVRGLGPEVKLNAGGSAGSGTVISVRGPNIPAPVDHANTGKVLQSDASSQESFDEQMQLTDCTGQPLKLVTVEVRLPSEMKPRILTTDENGLLPRVHTTGTETARIDFHWDASVVSPQADDYARSRNNDSSRDRHVHDQHRQGLAGASGVSLCWIVGAGSASRHQAAVGKKARASQGRLRRTGG